jgi:hypothetical protein
VSTSSAVGTPVKGGGMGGTSSSATGTPRAGRGSATGGGGGGLAAMPALVLTSVESQSVVAPALMRLECEGGLQLLQVSWGQEGAAGGAGRVGVGGWGGVGGWVGALLPHAAGLSWNRGVNHWLCRVHVDIFLHVCFC